VPDAPPKKRFLKIPPDFWDWTEEQKAAWSHSVAVHIATCVAEDERG